ncbi:hypothetical protein OG943_26100 [Amycolatopsis sp. NBC_00345]|uniref:hypothetical protein n=1 Tax=Amycolatopsis sp. NBC_00345 TaxID=2975955 RepID=UPI002E2750BD
MTEHNRRVAGRVAAGALAATVSAIALSGVAFADQRPAAREADSTPLTVTTAGYPLEVRLVTATGDGYAYEQPANTTQALATPPGVWSTVTFRSNGVPVIGYAPIDAGKTFTCVAGGSTAGPRVDCSY